MIMVMIAMIMMIIMVMQMMMKTIMMMTIRFETHLKVPSCPHTWIYFYWQYHSHSAKHRIPVLTYEYVNIYDKMEMEGNNGFRWKFYSLISQ